jgi:subtilisin family serine protease
MKRTWHRRAAASSAGAGTILASLLLGPGAMSFLGAAPAVAASYSGDQWGLDVIGAPTAWQYGTASGIRIGIVDSGVDPQQEDLAGKIVAQQYFVSNPSSSTCEQSAPAQNPAADDYGHGTHVSGIAAARGVGVSGVAPNASLVVAKVLDCKGNGNGNDVVAGIDWAVANGARVINLSLGDASIAGIDPGGSVKGSALGNALQSAWNAGAIPVVAAGNNGDGPLGCTLGCLGDADYSGVPAVIVAATGSPADSTTNQLAWYSNNVNAAQWGVAAPGGDDNPPTTPTCGQYDPKEILSTYWMATPPQGFNATNCYASDEGTSMATPFVSGALALLLGRGLTPTQAVQTLLSTANHSVSCGSVCSGLVDIAAAMQATAAPHPASSGASAPPPSKPAPRGSVAASAGTTTTGAGAPTTTSVAPTTSTSSATKQPRAATLRGRSASADGGSGWWLVPPVLVGLAAAGSLGFFGRRRLLLQRARVQSAPSDPTDPPTPA